jgi:TPR repeat protein
MKTAIGLAVLGLALSSPAWAGIEEGRAALRAGDAPTAFAEFGAAARGGDAEAQYLFATMLKDGVGADAPDLPAALAWYERAAKAGYAPAQLNYGYMLFHGEGVAADRPGGLSWYERAAQAGLAAAQYDAGKVYWDGEGVPRDPALARSLFKSAADQGLPEAQFALGVALSAPPDADAQAAFSWFSRAAKQGEPQAYAKLAALYLLGRGVEKDVVAAAAWAVLAEGAGDPMGAQLRLKLENDLTPEQKTQAMAKARAFVPERESP